MINEYKDLLQLTPVKTYNPPKIPTLKDTQNNPAMLKKLPRRWQKNAAVIACVGFTGAVTLSGCLFSPVDDRPHHGGGPVAPYYVVHPTEQETTNYIPSVEEPNDYPIVQQYEQMTEEELNLRIHTGGAGAGPFYIVHLTEQEALSIIRAQLEAAGLNLSSPPLGYTVSESENFQFWGAESGYFGLDLYDEENGVAISHITWEENNQPFFSHGGNWLANNVTEAFAEQMNDISVGVFFNPGEFLGYAEDWWGWEAENLLDFWDEEVYVPPTAERKAEARIALVDNLTQQVQQFIEILQAEGIL